jgi:hypothetical protein
MLPRSSLHSLSDRRLDDSHANFLTEVGGFGHIDEEVCLPLKRFWKTFEARGKSKRRRGGTGRSKGLKISCLAETTQPFCITLALDTMENDANRRGLHNASSL